MAGETGTEWRGTSSEGERYGFDSNLFQFVTEAPSDQETGEVWADLDASANLTDGGGTLEDGDGMTCVCETVGSLD